MFWSLILTHSIYFGAVEKIFQNGRPRPPIKYLSVKQIEDITWPRGDTKFLFEF